MSYAPNLKYVSAETARAVFRAWVGLTFADRYNPPSGKLVPMDVRPTKAAK